MKKIKKAAVIGSGVMGGGIAALLASAGVETLLLDIVPADLSAEEKTDRAARNRIVKAGLDAVLSADPPLFMHKKDARRIAIGNLEDDFRRLGECDWIVEVVVENLNVKRQLFQRIESVRRADAVVSSNTSGIPLQKMSEGRGLDFKRHFLGTHFFNPVRYMKLLEIIPGAETLPEILDFMADFGAKTLGKGIVRAKDTPNFIANRIGVHGMVRAMQLMLEDGLTIPEVDAVFGPALGRPKTAMFRTADLVGLDTLRHVAENAYELVVDDEQRERFVLPAFVDRMIEKNYLGKKAQSGFYKTELTPEWKKIYKAINPETLEYEPFEKPGFPCLKQAGRAGSLPEKLRAVLYGQDKGARFAWKVMAGSLIYAADRIPEIADTVVAIDQAMKWGFNFETGPFETWDAIGLAESVQKMERDGFKVPAKIKRMLADGHTSFYKMENGIQSYYDFEAGTYTPLALDTDLVLLKALKNAGKTMKTCASASLVDLGDGVLCCEFHTKMNTLNGEILDFIPIVLDEVSANGVGLVIGNQAGGVPGAFSAGADLKMLAALAQAKKFERIESASRTLQELGQQIRYEPFPVVAAPFGLTLGGGCEISLAADRIVAHAELYMGLVEIGVGLLPAGGGCLNLWKKFMAAVPEVVQDLDLAKFFLPAFMNVVMAKVSASAADARANGFLGPADRIVFNRDYLIGEAKKEVLKMAADGYAPPVREKVRVMGQGAHGMVNAEIYNMLHAGFISQYDAYLAARIARVLSGGDVRENSEVEEEVILTLEREAFMEFWQQEKTADRIEHMLKTGKPLRN